MFLLILVFIDDILLGFFINFVLFFVVFCYIFYIFKYITYL